MLSLLLFAFIIHRLLLEAISDTFKVFFRLVNYYIIKNLMYLTNTISLFGIATEKRTYLQEVNWLKNNKTRPKFMNNEDTAYPTKKYKQISENIKKVTFGDIVQNEKELKGFSLNRRQLYHTGDNCKFSISAMHYFKEFQNNPKEGISHLSKSNQETNQNKRLRNSKYTISSIKFESSNSKILLKFDELNKKTSAAMKANQAQDVVLKDLEICESVYDKRNNCHETKHINYHLTGITVSAGTTDLNKSDTAKNAHKFLGSISCLGAVDSRNVGGIEDNQVTPDELDFDMDKELEQELLTPEELSSVEIGCDDHWLYRVMSQQRVPCYESKICFM